MTGARKAARATGGRHEDQIRHRRLAACPDPGGQAACHRFRPHQLLRFDPGACRDRMRHRGLRRSAPGRRQRRGGNRVESPDRARAGPAHHRQGPAADQPALGHHVQRQPRAFRGRPRARLPDPRPARHHDLRHQRHRHRALGHPGQVARRPGPPAARRQAARPHAGLCLGRLGPGGPDRRRAAALPRHRRLQGGQDAGRLRRRRPRDLGRPRPRRAQGAGRRRSTSCATPTAPMA